MKRIIALVIVISILSTTLVSGAYYTVPKQSFKINGAKSSSNKQVVIVKKGKIKALKKGKTTIKVGKKKIKLKVWSRNKMEKELGDIADYFDYLYSGTVNTNSSKSIKKGIEITKNMQTENTPFVRKLKGKKFKSFKKHYSKAIKRLKLMNKHLKIMLKTLNDKDEYGDHTEEYEKAKDDYEEDIWKWWFIKLDLTSSIMRMFD